LADSLYELFDWLGYLLGMPLRASSWMKSLFAYSLLQATVATKYRYGAREPDVFVYA
jgi:hypothetical protein